MGLDLNNLRREVMNPITVVTSVFNGEETIREAVNSIITQSITDFEYIIVNDGSTDHTKEILDDIVDPRIKIIHVDENQGAAKGLNLAIENSSGNLIAIQDVDDVSFPNRLEEQFNFLNQNVDVNLVGSYISCFSIEKSTFLNRMKKEMEHLINSNESLYTGKYLFYGMPFCHGTFMFSKTIFKEMNGYTTDYHVAYDYDLLVRFFNRTKIKKLPKILYKYRISQNSLSKKDLVKTNLESIEISIRGIIENCSQNTNFIIIGTKNACANFKEHIQPKINNKNIVYFAPIPEIINQLGHHLKSSTIVILDSNGTLELVKWLEKMGFIVNHNLFLIWNLMN